MKSSTRSAPVINQVTAENMDNFHYEGREAIRKSPCIVSKKGNWDKGGQE